MQTINKKLLLIVIFIIVGFAMSVQLSVDIPQPRIYDAVTVDVERINMLENRVQELEGINEQRNNKIVEYQNQLNAFENYVSQIDGKAKRIHTELQKVRTMAGLIELNGSGIEVTISDSERQLFPNERLDDLLVHDTDLLLLINDLKAGGAEAISINDYRILSSSQIRCGGPIVIVDDRRFAPPYVIRAIGNFETMESVLKEEDGIYNLLSYYGLRLNIKKLENITIHRYMGSINSQYAEPVEMKEGE